jgi:hypothetical protein
MHQVSRRVELIGRYKVQQHASRARLAGAFQMKARLDESLYDLGVILHKQELITVLFNLSKRL